MTFAGSYLTAFLMKEMLTELLGHLQVLGPASSISFESICRMVMKVHKHFHQTLRPHLQQGHELDFFFGGYCPSGKVIRVARFSIDEKEQTSVCKEILVGAGFSYETIGLPRAGKLFTNLVELNRNVRNCRTHFTVLRRLRDVIHDKRLPQIAGTLQYGDFQDDSFTLYGGFDIVLENEELHTKEYIRGAAIEGIDSPASLSDLFLTYSYINPFSEDVQGFDCSSFFDSKHNRHALDELITVYPYDPNWPDEYYPEAQSLQNLMGETVLGMEHIGGTSIEGMVARPVIDIMVGVDKIGDTRMPPFDLSKAHYTYLGSNAPGGGLLFRKRGEKQDFDLHIVPFKGEQWRSRLRFRDILLQNPSVKNAHAEHKLRIVNRGSWTSIRYQNEKTPIVSSVLAGPF
jgi:GrpB-like predicted nucleotidyltransferase (UPF0157 family)